mmetsp:Transcript_3872/g.7428  ORF Transcript_3872/g.7428 Transcript_3872/m.7428 type:complete len:339 (+) Transcript_3872:327-1343(+)
MNSPQDATTIISNSNHDDVSSSSSSLLTSTRPKGPLALLVKPPTLTTSKSSSLSSSLSSSNYHLQYFACNSMARCLTRRGIIRSSFQTIRQQKRQQYQQQQQQQGQEEEELHYQHNHKLYHPYKNGFTLLFFCEMNCKNSQRFTLVLGSFLKTVQSMAMENCKNDQECIKLQLICIPNDDLELSSLLPTILGRTEGVQHDVVDTENHQPTVNDHGDDVLQQQQQQQQRTKVTANILTHLMSCCEFWHMGYDHINRLSMIRMLSVSVVPTLIVIDNDSGRVVTMRGMEAVEYACSVSDMEQQQEQQQRQEQCEKLLEEWKQGKSGIPWMYSVVNSCVVC